MISSSGPCRTPAVPNGPLPAPCLASYSRNARAHFSGRTWVQTEPERAHRFRSRNPSAERKPPRTPKRLLRPGLPGRMRVRCGAGSVAPAACHAQEWQDQRHRRSRSSECYPRHKMLTRKWLGILIELRFRSLDRLAPWPPMAFLANATTRVMLHCNRRAAHAIEVVWQGILSVPIYVPPIICPQPCGGPRS